MASYKRDVNLFKAAGGGVTKGKKMPLTKKLLIVMVIVTVIAVGAIAFLMYLRSQQVADLKKATDRAEALTYTGVVTKTALEDYNSVAKDLSVLSAIEYYNEAKNAVISCLSDKEIDSIKDFIREDGNFSYEYDFGSVIESLIDKASLAQYDLDAYSDDYSATLNNLQYVYSALCFMKNNASLYSLLHGQETETNYLWYAYYRGQMIMLLKGGDQTVANNFIQDITDGNHLVNKDRSTDGYVYNYSPFMSILQDVNGSKTAFNFNIAFTFDIDGEAYSVFCVTRKNVVERVLQCIEDCMATAKESDATLNCEYHLIDFNYNGEGKMINFTISMNQSETFGLEDVCQAIETSAFFAANPNFAYETSDEVGLIEKEVEFVILRTPFDVMQEAAETLYAIEGE
jgi:hypothetical protein